MANEQSKKTSEYGAAKPVREFLAFMKSNPPYVSSKYWVQFSKFPDGLKITESDDAEDKRQTMDMLGFTAEDVTIPGNQLTIATADFPQIEEGIVTRRTYDDITIKFMCTQGLPESRLFLSWMDLAYNINNGKPRFKDSYVGTMEIILYDKERNPRAVYRFEDVFPTKVGTIGLKYSNKTDVPTIDVTFSYKWYTLQGNLSTSAATQDKMAENKKAS